MQCSFGEFFEDINDALKEAVRALGGVKQVGALLWPEVAPDTAGNKLRDCLNDGRREKLSPEQFIFILRKAREAGYHSAMEYVATECGYSKPVAVDPKDELAELLRENNEMRAKQLAQAERIEKALQRFQIRSVA